MTDVREIKKNYHVVAVTAGYYGPENKRCYFIITARDGMWGLNIVPMESCSRLLRAMWITSDALSTALIPLFMPFYHSRYKVDTVPSSIDGLRALRIGKVEVLHYTNTPFAQETIPILIELLTQDPSAAQEILNRVKSAHKSKAAKANEADADKGGEEDVR